MTNRLSSPKRDENGLLVYDDGDFRRYAPDAPSYCRAFKCMVVSTLCANFIGGRWEYFYSIRKVG